MPVFSSLGRKTVILRTNAYSDPNNAMKRLLQKSNGSGGRDLQSKNVITQNARNKFTLLQIDKQVQEQKQMYFHMVTTCWNKLTKVEPCGNQSRLT